jgi:hypothetical protein
LFCGKEHFVIGIPSSGEAERFIIASATHALTHDALEAYLGLVTVG